MAEASVQSVERAFALLERLSARPQGVGLVELSELTGLHKSTTHRLLACLGAMGYVVKDSQSGRYRLTYKLLELSNAMLEDMDVLSVAKPHLDQLSQRTGETVHLMVPEGTQGVYIYKSDVTGQGQMRSKVGLQVPLVVTAAGKAMLATGSDEEARRVWAQSDHTPLTEHTITDEAAFLANLARARADGWAVDDEENELGVRCVGAAVPDYRGRAVAAMSISANAARMTPQRVTELAGQLLACRDSICQDLGLRPGSI